MQNYIAWFKMDGTIKICLQEERAFVHSPINYHQKHNWPTTLLYTSFRLFNILLMEQKPLIFPPRNKRSSSNPQNVNSIYYHRENHFSAFVYLYSFFLFLLQQLDEDSTLAFIPYFLITQMHHKLM